MVDVVELLASRLLPPCGLIVGLLVLRLGFLGSWAGAVLFWAVDDMLFSFFFPPFFFAVSDVGGMSYLTFACWFLLLTVLTFDGGKNLSSRSKGTGNWSNPPE
jgi:hypothetical protein